MSSWFDETLPAAHVFNEGGVQRCCLKFADRKRRTFRFILCVLEVDGPVWMSDARSPHANELSALLNGFNRIAGVPNTSRRKQRDFVVQMGSEDGCKRTSRPSIVVVSAMSQHDTWTKSSGMALHSRSVFNESSIVSPQAVS